MKNFVQSSDNITVAAPAAVTSGDPVVIGDLFGIACGDAENGATVTISTRGVFSVPVAAAADVSVGDALFWDAADGEMNLDSGNAPAGVAVTAAGVGVTSVHVKIG